MSSQQRSFGGVVGRGKTPMQTSRLGQLGCGGGADCELTMEKKRRLRERKRAVDVTLFQPIFQTNTQQIDTYLLNFFSILNSCFCWIHQLRHAIYRPRL
ncbi:hypothetical protein VNO77_25371 [Canavalia gladiata]|uniref:Uncharacterized protein n=1 Tax=Canavalia gladiata TaxID=3824 RepID=A0AAN9L8J3_CANGL